MAVTPEINIVDMTPQRAGQWLLLNDPRRTERADHELVANYAAQMRAGQWKFTGDPLKFNVNGHLIDGTHRLLAIVASGWSGPMAVCHGLPIETAWVMDPPGRVAA